MGKVSRAKRNKGNTLTVFQLFFLLVISNAVIVYADVIYNVCGIL